MKSKVADLKPEMFSNTLKKMAEADPAQYFAGLPPFMTSHILQQPGSLTTSTSSTVPKSLVPTKESGVYGSLPGVSGMISIQGLPGQPFSIPMRKLNPNLTKDKLLLEQEKELYDLINLGTQEEVDRFFGNSKNRDFLSDHPMSNYYLASPKGLKWLTENLKGNAFLATDSGLQLLPDIANVVRDPRVSGTNGPLLAQKLYDISRKAIEEKARTATQTEMATTRYLLEAAQVKGMTEQLKPRI
jgi:hypothetical protein